MAVFSCDLGALGRNYEKLRTLTAPAKVLPFLKADAYGIGLGPAAETLAAAGADTFCCARAEDALFLKNSHPETDVWLCSSCGYTQTLGRLIAAGCAITVGGADELRLAASCRDSEKTALRVCAAVDTGMGRFGMSGAEVENFCNEYNSLKNIQIVSTFTHFANCFGGKKCAKATEKQWRRFLDAVETMRALGVETGLLHAANSAAALLYPQYRADAVRCGSALLGRSLGAADGGLEKVGALSAQVLTVRSLKKGESVGYGSVFTAKHDMKIAIIDAGHADGIFLDRRHDGFRLRDRLYNIKRELTAKPLCCVIDGKSARVVGRVGLTNLAADVTDINCAAGMSAQFEINPALGAARETTYD